MSLTPNSDLTRTVKVRVSANELSERLHRVCLDAHPSPVKILFQDTGLSVWTHDNAKTIQAIVNEDLPEGGLKVGDPCVMCVEPKEFADLLRAKFNGKTVQIETEAGQPIEIKSSDGSTAVYHPADESEANIVPDHWILPVAKSGLRQFPMFDNEEATTSIKISRDEIMRGLTDMRVAKAPYVVFSFSDSGSTCESGHWGAKTNRSRSPITADVDGENTEVCFTNNLDRILNAVDGDNLTIQKHQKGGFAVIEGTTTTIVATEAVKEV